MYWRTRDLERVSFPRPNSNDHLLHAQPLSTFGTAGTSRRDIWESTRDERKLIIHLGIKEYSDWPTIPQLYVEKEFIGGCDILTSMHQNGELAKLLEEKNVLAKEE